MAARDGTSGVTTVSEAAGPSRVEARSETRLDARVEARIGGPGSIDTVWRSLTIFCRYRIVAAVILGMFYWGMQRQSLFEPSLVPVAFWALTFLLVAGVLLALAARLRTPAPFAHLTLQVLVDVIAISCLTYSAGGVKSGIGLLLLVSIAASGLVSRGRIAFFHAALAALAILSEQSWRFLSDDAAVAEFLQAGLQAGSYFIVAGLAYTLAKYAEGAERVAAERGVDLANLAQINELVIRDMQDGFIVVDEQGRIRQRNAQGEALVGSLRGALNGRLADCSPPLAAMLDAWRREPDREFAPIRDPLTQREVQVRFVAIGQARGTGASPTVIFVEDAGRIRAQAQQLKLAALGRLTASIAHEIRNPLSSINHAAELLQEEVEGEPRRSGDVRLLTIIRDNAFRLDRMVQEVLYLSRRDRTHPETLALAAYLSTFIADFCGNEKIAPSSLSLECPEGIAVRADRSHLNQILWNLVRNAMRHGQPGAAAARIEVQADPRAQRVRIDITDNGPGVADEAAPHLFEPFFTTQTTGTGLGLYIARELADVNGASLEHAGNGITLPSGATFRLTLPIAPSP